MNQRPKNSAPAPGEIVNWPLIMCHFASLPVELMLHDVRTFGLRSVGPRAAGSALLMFIFVVAHPDDNCLPLVFFMLTAILLSLIAHIIARVRNWRGVAGHTRYTGSPYLLWIFPFSEMTAKRIEPFLALFAGWGIHAVNQPLGSFLLTAAIGLGFKVGIELLGNTARALDINDALVEQKVAIGSLRHLRR